MFNSIKKFYKKYTFNDLVGKFVMFMVGFFSGKFILANDPVPSFGKIFLFVVVMATIFMAPYFILKYREENKES